MKNEFPTKRPRGRLVCSDNKSVYMQTEKNPCLVKLCPIPALDLITQ